MQLDPKIFNQSLYSKVIDVWFPGMDLSGQSLDVDVVRRWFLGTPEERRQFDGVCREAFAHALESVGPKRWPEPSAEPFVAELQRIEQAAGQEQSEEAAWAALSLTLLLDQMPRNIFRTDEGLRDVYTHFDQISYQLNRALLSNAAIPRPDRHPVFSRSAAHRLWFYMPLMHSEDLQAHDQFDDILAKDREELGELDAGKGSRMFITEQVKAEKSHRDILEKFGRYPHRNSALDRQSTAEEEAFLRDGGATFGVGTQKKDSS